MRKLYFLLIVLFALCTAKAQVINITDPNFKARLLLANNLNYIAWNAAGNGIFVDSNFDGQIQLSEALQVAGLNMEDQHIYNLDGIESFANLEYLNCSFNLIAEINLSTLTHMKNLNCNYNGVMALDASGCPNLKELTCAYNQMGSLNVSGLTNLEILNCGYNHLSNLDVSGFVHLKELNLSGNQFSAIDLSVMNQLELLYLRDNVFQTIDVTHQNALKYLVINNNQLSSIDLSHQSNLLTLSVSNNQLSTIDVTAATQLESFGCDANLFTTIDVGPFENLSYFSCKSNPNLATLNIKNGINEINLDFSGNPNLHYICADESQMNQVQTSIVANGFDCHVNTYCSFKPGGKNYTIQGNNRYDENGNGCDADDVALKNLNLSLSNGINFSGYSYSSSGSYEIPVAAGTYTITPNLENPEYFSISPTTANVTFPAAASPFHQDFCLTANGNHSDLEVTILPITSARPGFDVTYKILIHNKGNQTQSGSVNLSYNDAILDFVSSNPGVLLQSAGLLVFDFDVLQSFATKQIVVTFNINSPQETPAVNSGDILHYTASIITATDETPLDNIFVLNQNVINAIDPNDKTCLEGNTITPEMVGKEVHYMIRFENTGTANAENIVVKDLIDTAKFDINSLIPIDGSAPFVTRINGNKVEFIFENINLPFDDAHNDGYVAFKIKTKSSLVLGDTFSNTASIYFDYNFPIVTDPAVTTVALLAVHDFAFEDYFRIYPNPAKEALNISAKKQIDISSVSIYNVLGQLVLVIPNAKEIKTVDVSGLKTGNYFIKIVSDKGISNAKFIKK